jgi:hypothetical protein
MKKFVAAFDGGLWYVKTINNVFLCWAPTKVDAHEIVRLLNEMDLGI